MDSLRLFGRIAVAGVVVLVLMLALLLVRSLVAERPAAPVRRCWPARCG